MVNHRTDPPRPRFRAAEDPDPELGLAGPGHKRGTLPVAGRARESGKWEKWRRGLCSPPLWTNQHVCVVSELQVPSTQIVQVD